MDLVRLSFNLVRDLSRSFRDHEIPDRAAQISYFLLFAVFPFLVALLGMLAMFDLQEQVGLLTRLLQDSMPPSISGYLVDEVHRIAFAETSGRIVVGLLVALWSSSRATAAAAVAHSGVGSMVWTSSDSVCCGACLAATRLTAVDRSARRVGLTRIDEDSWDAAAMVSIGQARASRSGAPPFEVFG